MNVDYYKKYEPIDGKWYITKELGSGAFGTVFEIERHDFSTMKAAMKIVSIPNSQTEIESFMSENYDLDETSVTSYFYGFVEEFVKEFQLMAKLKGHTNIVSYEDHDVKPKNEGIGWDIFIRMELLTPLNDFYKQNRPTQQDIIKLGIDICKALETCQKYNIIHRDIKPSNIFVSETGEYKLGDFGVARTLEKTSSGLSKKGTYTYMAPEVYRGEIYNSSIDTYSLGIVLYKLLNNNLEPFRQERTFADSERALEMRMIGKSFEKPMNATDELSKIVLKACSFNPKDRYASPTTMREELEELLRFEPKQKNSKTVKLTNETFTQEKADTETNDNDDSKTTGIFETATQCVQDREAGLSEIQKKTKDTKSESIEADTILSLGEIKAYYIGFWKNIFNFKGVVGRKEFWILTFINAVSILIVNFLSCLPLLPIILVTWITFFAVIVGGISLCTRRLHDVGLSGHLQWLHLTIVGTVIIFILCLRRSKENNNRYDRTEVS